MRNIRLIYRAVCVLTALIFLLSAVIGCSGREDSPQGTDIAPGTAQTDTAPADIGTAGPEQTEEKGENEDKNVFDTIRKKAEDGTVKILFIGDSLTYYNDMPIIFESLCKAAGKSVKVQSLTKGGTGIAMMRDDPAMWKSVSDAIVSESWDIVVFQPNRNHPVMTEAFPYYPFLELSAARDMTAMIRDAGALPLLYSSFGVKKGYVTRDGATKNMTMKEYTDLITAYNAAVAQDIGCPAVYVGAAFNRVSSERSDLELSHTDLAHPSALGSYLIASSFYSVVFGDFPEGFDVHGGTDKETADYLRSVARDIADFVPESVASIEQIEKPIEKFSFVAHGYPEASPAGRSDKLKVDGNTVTYVYTSGDPICLSYMNYEGETLAGSAWSVECDIEMLNYAGTGNPSGGIQLIALNGNVIRVYSRTPKSNITGKDCATANGKYQIRVDGGSGSTSVDISGFDSRIHFKAELTPEKLIVSINGSPFAEINTSGTAFANGQTTEATKLTSDEYQLGFVYCYSDVIFSNVIITK